MVFRDSNIDVEQKAEHNVSWGEEKHSSKRVRIESPAHESSHIQNWRSNTAHE